MATSALFVLCAAIVPIAQPQSDTTVWGGVYAAEQAARGKAEYEASCLACHREDLEGSPAYPAIAGPFFMRNWEAGTLGELFQQMRSTMPEDAPGSLPEASYIDVFAYMLEVNGFPAGDRPLRADATALAAVRIVPKNGPTPVQTGTLVSVVGCLRGSAERWEIHSATAPVRVRTFAIQPAALSVLAAMPAGSRAFQLLRLGGRPAATDGDRVEARGLLFESAAEGDGLSTARVTPLGVRCS